MDATDIARLEAAQPIYRDDSDPSVVDGWRPTDLGSLEWALSRVADLEAEARENAVALADAHRRLDLRAESMTRRVQRGVAFFRGAILSYMSEHKSELLKGGARKSRVMLHGSVGWRKTGGRLRVVDEKALAEWVAAQPVELGLFRIRIEPAMKELQAYCEANGLIPPGTEREVPTDVPYVKAVSPSTSLAKTEDDDE